MKQFKNGPRCPNHGVPLILTPDPGRGICPISTCVFDYKADMADKKKKVKVDINGNLVQEQDFTVKNVDGTNKG